MLTITGDKKYVLTIPKSVMLNIAAEIIQGEDPSFDAVNSIVTKNVVQTSPSLTESDYAEMRFEFDAPDTVTNSDPFAS